MNPKHDLLSQSITRTLYIPLPPPPSPRALRGSLGKDVTPRLSNTDPIEDRNNSFCYPVWSKILKTASLTINFFRCKNNCRHANRARKKVPSGCLRQVDILVGQITFQPHLMGEGKGMSSGN